MTIENKLRKAFPGHTIEMKQLSNNIGDSYSIFYDGNLLRIKFNDWSEMFIKLYHRDIKEEEFQKLVAEIKLELSRLPKKV